MVITPTIKYKHAEILNKKNEGSICYVLGINSHYLQ